MDAAQLLRNAWKRLGPGFITGTSDDDPSAIGTYAQAGAQFGLAQLWTALFTFPMMAATQELCGRIGLVTGLSLAAVLRRHYARPIVLAIVFVQLATNTINIGADLSGMAQGGQLLWHLPYPVWLGIAVAVMLPLMAFLPYRHYAGYLRFLGLTLLVYIAAAVPLRIDWRAVLHATFVPVVRFNKDFLVTFVGVLGTTISPYEFFWQASEEVEELVEQDAIPHEGVRPPRDAIDVGAMRWDTTFGMFVCNLLMYFIILVTALTLGAHGVTNIETAAQAAQALRPLAGPVTFVLFALGIISAGFLAIPVMASSSAYALAGAFDWPRGLSGNPLQRPAFYGVIVGSTLLGLLINLAPVPPFKLLIYAAVLNGIVAPPLLLMVLLVSENPRVMGRHRTPWVSRVLVWTLFALMSLSVVALIVFSLRK
ncbi:MAG: divalent metal cation transporter [Candidatus Eremiobacteraeota bacterium]|nr:divalent metal cation transporter [Candidatus Eremiobacteraeota bacterium]MBV8644403.1 divalent metal cation transporter [Candidatus Eremiobacteraeota bacterium]